MTKKELKYVNSLKEENERVKNMLLRFVDVIGKLKNIDDIVNISLIPLMTEENQKIRAEIKSEAYKEFVECVKEEITDAIINNGTVIKERVEKHNADRYEDAICLMCDAKVNALAGIEYFIDNLLKELIGE